MMPPYKQKKYTKNKREETILHAIDFTKVKAGFQGKDYFLLIFFLHNGYCDKNAVYI